MKRISVFCGSSFGTDAVFEQQAWLLGKTLAQKNIGLVYGGAHVGLMGAVANGVLEHGGEVTGIIPRFLQEKEIAHTGLTQLILVDTMHERKNRMEALCDGVITLPGGFGTMEELFEMLTWAQLGLHGKPVGILNTDGFYNHLITMTQTMVNKGFLKPANQEMLLVSEHIEELLEKMLSYQPPATGKWISKDKV